MTDTKVSIIIPIYNVEQYLRECLDSLVKQTLQEIEIICVNDGSPDNSLSIIKEYAEKDKRVIIIDKENGGYASAINAGLEIAKGEFIQIVESDDYCKLNMCEDMYNTIKDSDADLITADYYTVRERFFGKKIKHNKYFKKNEISTFSLESAPEIVTKPSFPWKNLYRKSFIDKYNIRMLQDGNGAYEDLPWNATVLSNAKKIIHLPKAYYYYRIMTAGASSSCGKPSMINYITRRAQIREIYIKNNLFNGEIKEHYWSGSLGGCRLFLGRIGKPYKKDYFKKMKELFLLVAEDNIQFSKFAPKRKKQYEIIISGEYEDYVKTESLKYKVLNFLKKG